MLRTLAALLTLLPLASGCAWDDWRQASPSGVEAPQRPGRAAPLNREEQDWVFRLGEWASTSPADSGDMSCAGALQEAVGDAPSRRLERLLQLARQACRRFETDRESPEGQRLIDGVMERVFAFETSGGLSRELPVRGGASDESRIEPLLSRVVGTVTKRAAEVRCWSDDDWGVLTDTFWPYGQDERGRSEIAGYAEEGEISLRGIYCRPLVDLHRGRVPKGALAKDQLAVSLSILAHESEHHLGEAYEARAECFGLQKLTLFAEALGASRSDADELVGLVWEDYRYLHETYRSTECRNGGELDLNPQRNAFP